MDQNLNGTLSSNADGEEQFPLIFGSYEALKSIGKGKFAVVYRARKIGDENIVALKRISVDMMDDKAREKCLKEVRLLQSLDHPNIIRYMDSFICENNLMIVYEWAAAGDLKRQLRKAQERGVGFEERVIWKYFSQISNAMQHMHDRRIMHRDLKPANIFLTLDGTIKVGDLGLSRELSEHTIQAHSKVGTPLYMSPEVLKGDGYDFKSDIWSLGCLLYELAMLKSPFKSEGLNLYSLFQKISNGDFQPLPENYSEELRSLVYGMISTRPQDRPEISYVCGVAQKMRSATNDKRQKSKTNLLASPSAASLSQYDSNTDLPNGENYRNGNEQAAKENGAFIGIAALEADPAAEAKANTEVEVLIPSGKKKPNGNRFTPVDSKIDAKKDTVPYQEEKGEVNGVKSPSKPDWSKGGNATDKKLLNRAQANKNTLPVSARSDLSDDETLPIERDNRIIIGNSREMINNGLHKNKNDYDLSPKTFSANESNVNTEEKPSHFDVMKPKAVTGLSNFYGIDRNSRTENMVNIDKPKNSPSYHDDPEYMPTAKDEGRAVTKRPKSANKNIISDRPKLSAGAINQPDFAKPPLEKAGSSNSVNSGNNIAAPMKRIDSATARKKLVDGLLNASPAFAVMEEVYGKLILLGFPMQDTETLNETRERRSFGRLLPIHFACDLNAFNSVAGHGNGHQFLQFQRFVAVAVWLCKHRLGGQAEKEASKIDMEQDSPTMIAKQLLRILQSIGSSNTNPSVDINEITPTSLTHGYGIQVCNTLNFLSDAALQKRMTELSAAANNRSYPSISEAILDTGDDDEIENVEEEIFEADVQNANEDDFLTTSGNEVAAPILASVVDPSLWREETERVAPQLRARISASGSGPAISQDTWNEHLLTLTSVAKRIFPPSESADTFAGSIKTQTKQQDDSDSILLAQKIASIKTYIDETLNKIKITERMMNNNENILDLGLNYSHSKQELIGLEAQQGEHQRSIDRLTSELSDIEEKHEEALAILQDKVGSTGDGGSNGNMVRLREAIQLIKKEVKEMNLNEHLLNHSLLKERMHLSKLAAVKRRGKKATKSSYGGKIADDNDDELLLSFG